MGVDATTPGEAVPQALHLQGKTYYLVPKEEYDRIRTDAQRPPAGLEASLDLEIGREIRLRRRRAGMTQAETAARAGIRLETLSRLENGRANPTVATLRAILRALEGGPA